MDETLQYVKEQMPFFSFKFVYLVALNHKCKTDNLLKNIFILNYIILNSLFLGGDTLAVQMEVNLASRLPIKCPGVGEDRVCGYDVEDSPQNVFS